MKTKLLKTFSWKTAIILSLGVGLLTVGLSVFLQIQANDIKSYVTENKKSAETAFIPAGPIGLGSSLEAPDQPARLVIAKIKVDVKIQGVGQTSNGEMGVPTNLIDVAWYNKGSLPGMPGSAVIAGHLNGKHTPNGVFRNISNLKPGDIVEVIDQKGKTLQFQVVALKTYDYNASASEVFKSDGSRARLNLITCAGDWIKSISLYNKRLVVFTELISND